MRSQSVSLPQATSLLEPQGARSIRTSAAETIDESQFAPVPRRVRDKDHVRFVAKQACLICGRTPSDAHHLRFAQTRALGRRVSDEFTVPLCRGHHRALHRHGDEGAWWRKAGVDPMPRRARFGCKHTRCRQGQTRQPLRARLLSRASLTRKIPNGTKPPSAREAPRLDLREPETC